MDDRKIKERIERKKGIDDLIVNGLEEKFSTDRPYAGAVYAYSMPRVNTPLAIKEEYEKQIFDKTGFEEDTGFDYDDVKSGLVKFKIYLTTFMPEDINVNHCPSSAFAQLIYIDTKTKDKTKTETPRLIDQTQISISKENQKNLQYGLIKLIYGNVNRSSIENYFARKIVSDSKIINNVILKDPRLGSDRNSVTCVVKLPPEYKREALMRSNAAKTLLLENYEDNKYELRKTKRQKNQTFLDIDEFEARRLDKKYNTEFEVTITAEGKVRAMITGEKLGKTAVVPLMDMEKDTFLSTFEKTFGKTPKEFIEEAKKDLPVQDKKLKKKKFTGYTT